MTKGQKQMTPLALEMLIQLFYMGDLAPQTAGARNAWNFLYQAGLVEFRDPQNPAGGHRITEKGKTHVRFILALPLEHPFGTSQNPPGEAEPRYTWSYWDDEEMGGPAPEKTATEALAQYAQGEFAAGPMTLAIFGTLTWDQQRRALETLGWRKVNR